MHAVLQHHVAHIRDFFHSAYKAAGAHGAAKMQHLLRVRVDGDHAAPASLSGNRKPLSAAKAALAKAQHQFLFFSVQYRLQLKTGTRSGSCAALLAGCVGHHQPALAIEHLNPIEMVLFSQFGQQGRRQPALLIQLIQQPGVVQQPLGQLALQIIQRLVCIGKRFMGKGEQADCLVLQQVGELLPGPADVPDGIQGQQEAEDDGQCDQQACVEAQEKTARRQRGAGSGIFMHKVQTILLLGLERQRKRRRKRRFDGTACAGRRFVI